MTSISMMNSGTSRVRTTHESSSNNSSTAGRVSSVFLVILLLFSMAVSPVFVGFSGTSVDAAVTGIGDGETMNVALEDIPRRARHAFLLANGLPFDRVDVIPGKDLEVDLCNYEFPQGTYDISVKFTDLRGRVLGDAQLGELTVE